MRLVTYFCSLVAALCCIAIAIELAARTFLPDAYNGYLIDAGDGKVKWTQGPYQPGEPSKAFNAPIALKKPADTIRIVTLGASGTEGWLTAPTVYKKYRQEFTAKDLSSYSRAMEFSLNELLVDDDKEVEVINLGIAAYNITDVIRMLKDSLRLDPDLLVIQIGGNETWTAKRADWSAYLSNDIPYLYSELVYEVMYDKQAGWDTLSTGGNAFNPLALLASKPRPVTQAPAGRDTGLEERLASYRSELERLGQYLQEKNLPVFFMIPSQNIAGYQPFGSMVKDGTDADQLKKLNEMVIEALALSGPAARAKFEEILAIDDGIAEANFRMGQFYLDEGNVDLAREHFWKANNKDIVLKRLPGQFHEASREFLARYGFPYLDTMNYFEGLSASGLVGYNLLDDDVHPNRASQFVLGNEIIRNIMQHDLLPANEFSFNPESMPSYEGYNDWTGFDERSAGLIAYLKAAHNFTTFARYRKRLQWDPQPERLLTPIVEQLVVANEYAPSRVSLYMEAILNLYLGRVEAAQDVIGKMECESSPEQAALINEGLNYAGRQIIGRMSEPMKANLRASLELKGCVK